MAPPDDRQAGPNRSEEPLADLPAAEEGHSGRGEGDQDEGGEAGRSGHPEPERVAARRAWRRRGPLRLVRGRWGLGWELREVADPTQAGGIPHDDDQRLVTCLDAAGRVDRVARLEERQVLSRLAGQDDRPDGRTVVDRDAVGRQVDDEAANPDG